MMTPISDATGAPSHARQVGRFLLHFIEMCAAMCVGGIALNAAFFEVLALFDVTYSRAELPALALLAIGINLAIVMTAWMRFRGHEWRPTLEMASTSIVLAVGVIAAGWIGVIDEGARLDSLTSVACPLMLIPMVLRWNLYAGVEESRQKPRHGSKLRQAAPT